MYSPVSSKNTCTDIRYSRIGVNFYRCTNSFHESLLHDLDTMQARRSRPRLTFSLVPPADFAFEIFFFPPVSSHLLILLLRLVIQPAGWFGLFFLLGFNLVIKENRELARAAACNEVIYLHFRKVIRAWKIASLFWENGFKTWKVRLFVTSISWKEYWRGDTFYLWAINSRSILLF